ncbi:MAG: 4-(cytidine 5'-diphospho)-2-C-methyl-D-erythritol kinase [Clostridia bacterium]|nr:4-(cytidine 5'-diphospho)-2-C-methyl-D-erythritol kinase [Clostridia bacterium]
MDTIFLKAPAKVNLSLTVLGRRPDGYHEIKSVLQTLDLADELAFSLKEPPQVQVSCRGPWAHQVPAGASNLVFRAATLMLEEAERVGPKGPFGARIELLKFIPAAAGLGGGSSDAACTLKGLNQLWQLGWDQEKLVSLAGELGSDVPFLVMGGTALAEGRGEKVRPFVSRLRLSLVLIKPPWGVSTPAVYRDWDMANPAVNSDKGGDARRQDRERRDPTQVLIHALEAGDRDRALEAMGNDLEPVTLKMHPELQEAGQALLACGATKVMLCGSGPTQMGIMDGPEAASRAARVLKGWFPGWWVQEACTGEPT